MPRAVVPATVLAAVLLLAHVALGHLHHYAVDASDDRLWLYYTAAEIGREPLSAELDRLVRQSMEAHGVADATRLRFEARAAYDHNYRAATWGYWLASRLTRPASGEAVPYHAALARNLRAGFGLTFAASVLVLLAVAVGMVRPPMMVAMLLALAGVHAIDAGLRLAEVHVGGLPTLLPRPGDPDEAILSTVATNTAALLLNPHTSLSPFGVTPRHHFLLLVLAVFALRWSGRLAASYGLVLALSLVHQSQTGLLLAILFATDLVVRPRELARPMTLLAIGATFVTFLARETLDTVFDLGGAMAVGVALAGGAGALLLLRPWRHARLGAALSRLDLARQRLVRDGSPGREVAVILALWLLILLVTLVANARATPEQSMYFWSQVNGRLLGMLRPALLLAPALWAVTRWGVASRWWVTAAALAVLPGLALASQYESGHAARLTEALARLDREVGPRLDPQMIGTLPEATIYYGLARALDRPETAPVD